MAVSVQRGITDFNIGVSEQTININSVNISQSYIFISTIGANTALNKFYSVKFIDSSTIRITRGGSTGSFDSEVAWEVITDTDATVIHGSTTLNDSNLSRNISISSVDTSKTFIYSTVNYSTGNSGLDIRDAFISNKLINSNTIQFATGGSSLNGDVIVEYQVVTISDAVVQSGVLSPFFASSISATITSVDLSKSILIFSSNTNRAAPRDVFVSGRFQNNTTVRFDYGGSTGRGEISYFVIECDRFSVETLIPSPISSTTQLNLSNTVDLSKSFLVSSFTSSEINGAEFENGEASISYLSNSQVLVNKLTNNENIEPVIFSVEVSDGQPNPDATVSAEVLNLTLSVENAVIEVVNPDAIVNVEVLNLTLSVENVTVDVVNPDVTVNAEVIELSLLIEDVTVDVPSQGGAVSVQSGIVEFGTTVEQTINIDPVDVSKSYIFISTVGDNQADDIFYTVEFVNNSSIIIKREDGGANNGQVVWQVVTDSNATVIHGATSITGTASVTENISSVDLSKTFLITTFRSDYANNSSLNRTWTTGKFNSSTQLQFEVDATPTTPVIINYQVVTISDATVQSGSIELVGVNSNPATISSVDPTKAFLVFSTRTSSSALSDSYHRGRISSPTEVDIRKHRDGGVSVAEFFVIECDRFSVQNISGSASNLNDEFYDFTTPVDLSRSIVIGSHTSSGTGTTQRNAQANFSFEDNDTVHRYKLTTGTTLETEVAVIEFAEGDVSINIDINVDVDTLELDILIPDSTVNTIQAITASPDSIDVQLSIPDVTVVTVKTTTVPVNALELDLSIEDVTVNTAEATTVPVNSLELNLSIEDVSVSTVETALASPDSIDVQLSIPEATVVTVKTATVPVNSLELNLSIEDVSVSTVEANTVPVNALELDLSIEDVTVVSSGFVTIPVDPFALNLESLVPEINTVQSKVIIPSTFDITIDINNVDISTEEIVDFISNSFDLNITLQDVVINTANATTVSTDPIDLQITINNVTVESIVNSSIDVDVSDLNIEVLSPSLQVEKNIQIIPEGLSIISTIESVTVIVVENNVLIKYWNGTEWIEGKLKMYNGTDWVNVLSLKRYDGTEWVEV
jgi:hypothetical protein